MDKTVLRNVIEALTPGQNVSVRMRGQDAAEEFTVVSTKRGRGKRGSLLATLSRPDGTGDPINIGTPTNTAVLNITVNGQFHGVNSEREEPVAYPTDERNATDLKLVMTRLLSGDGTQQVRIASILPEYNGTFIVTNGRREKGKYGQVHLYLQRASNPDETTEVWSYRHSGVIQSIEIL